MLLFGRRNASRDHIGPYPGATAAELIPPRLAKRVGTTVVTSDTALRHSAVWACIRNRADLLSTFPVDVFRRVEGVQVEVPTPPVLRNPGGEQVDILEWMYSTQVDLDRMGNDFGIITARNAWGLPAQIELQQASCTTVRRREGRLQYRFDGSAWFEAEDVWHERQYTVAGWPLGLSPVAYAAWSIGEYQSIQDFALQWFGAGGVPRAHLRNTAQTVSSDAAIEIKDRFQSTVVGGGLFVTGKDWEYDMIQAEQTGMEWLEAKRYGVVDVARFFNWPADLIDGAVSGSSITYANITQRNLQALVHNLGPTVVRRERALSKLVPRPQYVKLNTDALLRMDPQTRAATLRTQIESRTLAPSEARELDNRPPFTESQLAEFDRLFPRRSPDGGGASSGGGPDDDTTTTSTEGAV